MTREELDRAIAKAIANHPPMTRQERRYKLKKLRKQLHTLPWQVYIDMMSAYWPMVRPVGHYCSVSYNERLN